LSSDAVALIERTTRRLLEEVPALAPLQLTVLIELKGRKDVQHFRLVLPAVEVRRGFGDGGKVTVSMRREQFNELAAKPSLAAWHDAYDHGRLTVSGPAPILRLIGEVVRRREARLRG
jgi:hypothetical protein